MKNKSLFRFILNKKLEQSGRQTIKVHRIKFGYSRTAKINV